MNLRVGGLFQLGISQRVPVSLKSVLPGEDERIVARDLQDHLRRMGYDVPALTSCKEKAIRVI
jgi:hypothetical protein